MSSKMHQDPNLTYPETNQFAFGYPIGKDEERVIKKGLVWSVLLKKDKNQQITIGEKRVLYTRLIEFIHLIFNYHIGPEVEKI